MQSGNSGGSIGGVMGAIVPPYGVEIIFSHSGVFARIVVICKSFKITPYTLIKSSETIVVAIKFLDLDSLQQYYHFNPFHKSTTLALKNYFPNAPFGFLNSLYLYVSTSIALLSLLDAIYM